jgi:hypothetical protein
MPSGRTALEMHTLLDTEHLTDAEYAAARNRIERVQDAADRAQAHIAARGFDPRLYLPGNIWGQLVPAEPPRFRTDYPAVDLMRLYASFAGYHLELLDRVDPGRAYFFPRGTAAGELDLLSRIVTMEDPAAIWEAICETIDPLARMLSFVGSHRMITLNVPATHVVDTPGRFGEIGMRVDGILCNRDTILCQSRINALLAGGCLDRIAEIVAERGTCRILEIGTGHGALARAIMALYPGRIDYVLLDLPTSLIHAAVYLGLFEPNHRILVPDDHGFDDMDPRGRCLFVPNYLLETAVNADHPIDVAINTMSMPEMSADQVHLYCAAIKAHLSPGGFFYEANNVVLPEHVDCKAIFASHFPVRRRIVSRAFGLGGETHEVWSNAHIPAIHDRPDEAAGPQIGPFRDLVDDIGYHALGQILADNLKGFPSPAVRAVKGLAAQRLGAAGLPPDVLWAWLNRVAGGAPR